MNKYILTLSILFASTIAFSQSNISPVKSVRIVKETKPPILNIVNGSVQFVEPSNNNAIDANERCKIKFQIKNTGKGIGYGCVAKISATGTKQGVSFNNVSLSDIPVGETKNVEIPINANMSTVDGQIDFVIQVDEPQGFGTDPIQLSVNTRAFEAPEIRLVDYTVTGASSGTLKKKEPFDLQLLLQNTKHGLAENVKVNVTFPNGVFVTDGDEYKSYATISGGEKKSLVYSLIVNNSYTLNEIPIKVSISEKHGKYAESKTISLKLNQTMASNKIVVDEKRKDRTEIKIASLSSDVDINIPEAAVRNSITFAVVVANESYQREADVPFALNDGRVFYDYCTKTFGIPDDHIHFVQNATLNNIKAEVEWISNVAKAYNGIARVLFYYAGHGIPNESNKSAYLLPTDGIGNNPSTAYSLDELYSSLGTSNAKNVTVILDACFSGAKRNGDMMASARGIAIKAKSGQPVGNMVVFSAAQGDETAYPNNDQSHGMFTYYLLKKLQETKGEATYDEIADYVRTQVGRQSIVQNNKSQTPTVIPATVLGDSWKNWTMK